MSQSSPHRRGQEAQFYHVHRRGTPGLLATGANDHHLPLGFMCPLFSLGHPSQTLLWAASLPCSPRFYPVFLSLSSNFPWTSSFKPISVPSGFLHFQSQCLMPTASWTSLGILQAGATKAWRGRHLPPTAAPWQSCPLPSCPFSHLRAKACHMGGVCGLEPREVRPEGGPKLCSFRLSVPLGHLDHSPLHQDLQLEQRQHLLPHHHWEPGAREQTAL